MGGGYRSNTHVHVYSVKKRIVCVVNYSNLKIIITRHKY